MRTIFAEYNPHRNSIDVYTSAGYMLRIDCWEAEKNLKTTPGSDCALNALAIDEPLEYARLYLDGTMQSYILKTSLKTMTKYGFNMTNKPTMTIENYVMCGCQTRLMLILYQIASNICCKRSL